MKKNITIVPKTRIATANKLGIDQTYQHDLIVDKSPLINVLKSRAIGISYAGAFKKLLDAYEESKQYIFVSQRKENVELLLDYVDNFHRDIKEEIDEVPDMVIRNKNIIRFSNGAMIVSLPSDPDALRTWHGDVWLDEFNFVKFVDAELLQVARGCLKPGNNQLMITSSAGEEAGEGYELWMSQKKLHPKKRVWKLYFLPYKICKIRGFVESIEKEKEEAIARGRMNKWRREYEGVFLNEETVLFSRAMVISAVKNVMPSIQIDYIGIDFGQKADATVARCAGKYGDDIIVSEKKLKYTKDSYTIQLEGIIEFIKQVQPKKVLVDKTAIGIRLLEELKESDVGYLVEGIQFDNNTKERMAMYLYTLLSSGKIQIPNDSVLIEQIQNIRRTKTASGMRRYSHDSGKHDDEFWAMCEAIYEYMAETTNNDIQIMATGESKVEIKPSVLRSRFSQEDLWSGGQKRVRRLG